MIGESGVLIFKFSSPNVSMSSYFLVGRRAASHHSDSGGGARYEHKR